MKNTLHDTQDGGTCSSASELGSGPVCWAQTECRRRQSAPSNEPKRTKVNGTWVHVVQSLSPKTGPSDRFLSRNRVYHVYQFALRPTACLHRCDCTHRRRPACSSSAQPAARGEAGEGARAQGSAQARQRGRGPAARLRLHVALRNWARRRSIALAPLLGDAPSAAARVGGECRLPLSRHRYE